MSETHTEGRGIHPRIFYPTFLLVVLLVAFASLWPGAANSFFAAMQEWLVDTFGWLYLAAIGIYLIVALFLAFSRYGAFKLGPDHSEPEFSYMSWFAMLFAAGMGIGLMFFGVAEPLTHYANPPTGDGQTPEAARTAMEYTMFHWTLHAWAVYAIVGLSLAYFSFRHGMPLRISSALYPFIGNKVKGPIGNIVDILAVFGTLFGVATSLGLGANQVAAGLNFLFGFPDTVFMKVVLIIVISGMATLSVGLGLDAGIRRVSEFNIYLAGAMLLFVILFGPTLYIFQSLIQNIGNYFSSVVNMTFNSFVYDNSDQAKDFMGDWTLFYWSWWISWSPFVGMFVARVSRGRTIREFVGGVLLVPLAVTSLWMAAFGDGAIYMVLNEGADKLLDKSVNEPSVALFEFFQHFPWTGFTSLIGGILVVTFFVTSSDSGSMVIDILTSRDSEASPAWQRIFWAILEGIVAMVLLLAGGDTGIEALQAASLASALPFSIILLVMAASLYKALHVEAIKQDSMRNATSAPLMPAGGGSTNWQDRLDSLVASPRRQHIETFLTEVVSPAMKEVAEKFEQAEMTAELSQEEGRYYITVNHGDEIDFVYGVRARRFAPPPFGIRTRDKDKGSRRRKESRDRSHYRAEVFLREGGQEYNILGYTKDQVIGDILSQYEKHLHFLQVMRDA